MVADQAGGSGRTDHISVVRHVSVVGPGGTHVVVVGEDGAEGGVALEPGEQVVVAVFEDLALDGGVLAALDQG